MHSRLCLIGSLSDSSDNEAECFLQDTVCFHVFGVNEFGIMWSDDETFHQFKFFSEWICFFKPSAGRVSVLCLSFIDWSENLPAADFRCINRVYRVCLLSAAVSWNIDTYKTLFSIREASVNLLTGRGQLGNTYISDTILMWVYMWCSDLIQCCVTAGWCHFLTRLSEKLWNLSQYRYGGTRSEILGCFVVQSERLIIYWFKKLQSVKPEGGASDEAFRSRVLFTHLNRVTFIRTLKLHPLYKQQ